MDYIYDKTIEEQKKEKENYDYIALNDIKVNSFQELLVANFFVLNNISFDYRKKYIIKNQFIEKYYTPDFIVNYNGKKIYIECVNLKENYESDIYSNLQIIKYKSKIIRKINYLANNNESVILLFAKYDNCSMIEYLIRELAKYGIYGDEKNLLEVTKITNSQKKEYKCPNCSFPLKHIFDKNYNVEMFQCTNELEICQFMSNDLNGEKMSIHLCEECGGLVTIQKNNERYYLECNKCHKKTDKEEYYYYNYIIE